MEQVLAGKDMAVAELMDLVGSGARHPE